MTESAREKAQEIINKEKWWDILSRFIDVLRINMFIVDVDGLVILPPEEDRFGGRLLMDIFLKGDLQEIQNFISHFQKTGNYLQYSNRISVHNFAIPVKSASQETIAYVIVGPVVLNKKLSDIEYRRLAAEDGLDEDTLLDEISGVRVVSNLMMNSILDLLSEIIRDNIELSLKEKELAKIRETQQEIPSQLEADVQEMYSTVYLDELLVTLLDSALKMTGTECGSIMMVDEKEGCLNIKVSRGLDSKKVAPQALKVGEGIAGLVAQTNQPFFIDGLKGDNRITHLLKRKEIRHALVMPLASQSRVIGVMNLHTYKEDSKLAESYDNLQHLSNLVSSVI